MAQAAPLTPEQYDELKTRYDQQNLTPENIKQLVYFFMDDPTQGTGYLNDLARSFDDDGYPVIQANIQKYIRMYQDEKSMPQYNEKAAMEAEAYKQKIQREIGEKQLKEKAQMEGLTRTNADPIADLIAKTKSKLIENPIAVGTDTSDKSSKRDKEEINYKGDRAAMPEASNSKIVIVAIAVFVLFLGFYISGKK